MAIAYESGGGGTGPNAGKTAEEIAAQTPERKKTSREILQGVNETIAGLPQSFADTQAAIDEANTATAEAEAATELAATATKSALVSQPGGSGIGADTKRSDAYQRLYDEFNALGLGALVEDSKDLLMNAVSISAMPDALRGTKAYKERFSANDARIKAGLKALSPAAYLGLEDQYQNVMKRYGLPESYYKPGLYGKQEGFEKLLANDVSNVELEDRIATAQKRVLNANPEVRNAIMKFYGDSITDGDILAYVLDPSNAAEMIKRKVTAAEIGGAAMAQGLTAGIGRSEELARFGVTKDQAQAGYVNVAQMAPRGSELAAIYQESPYGQTEAEAEVFNTSGAADAAKKRKKLAALETASFSGAAGVGALGRDRANAYGATQSGFGSY